jgi:hypothetical protein
VSHWGNPRYRYVNGILAAGAPVACAVMVIGAFAHSSSWFTRDFPPAAADKVARLAAQDPQARIFANERFADWLVLQHPSLAGRIAFDGRFELLKAKELERVVRFRARVADWKHVVSGYRLLVLYPSAASEGKVTSALLDSRTRHAVYRDKRIAVITQDASRGSGSS